ncbi:MAG TPA: hypothetical protein VM305_03085 [Candidatus Limnocylindrales bacterium]|nr:hypothetical protein [Candidatus Limnocylindrales bacterium]
MDSLTMVILVSFVPILPLILGVGLFYELFSRLDFRDALSTRAHWVLATAATIALIAVVFWLLLARA